MLLNLLVIPSTQIGQALIMEVLVWNGYHKQTLQGLWSTQLCKFPKLDEEILNMNDQAEVFIILL